IFTSSYCKMKSDAKPNERHDCIVCITFDGVNNFSMTIGNAMIVKDLEEWDVAKNISAAAYASSQRYSKIMRRTASIAYTIARHHIYNDWTTMHLDIGKVLSGTSPLHCYCCSPSPAVLPAQGSHIIGMYCLHPDRQSFHERPFLRVDRDVQAPSGISNGSYCDRTRRTSHQYFLFRLG
ncbi:hypothetical protein PMAYCL1PPCAC_21337, partial [Pristionchus mayeri]